MEYDGKDVLDRVKYGIKQKLIEMEYTRME